MWGPGIEPTEIGKINNFSLRTLIEIKRVSMMTTISCD